MDELQNIGNLGKPLTIDEKLDKVLILAVNSSEDIKELKEDMKEVKTDIGVMKKTLNQHTTILDGLVKEDKNTIEKNIIDPVRLSRMEEAIKLLAAKVGLKLKW